MELAAHLLEKGLGLPSSSDYIVDESHIEERIEERITPLRKQVTQLDKCIATAIQKELDPLLGELPT